MAVPALAQAPAPSADTELVAPPAWAFNDVACAPALRHRETRQEERTRLRVVGVQDPAIRELARPWRYARRQRRLECRAFRRASAFSCAASYRPWRRPARRRARRFTRRAGSRFWASTRWSSTATVVHACEAILFDDYLEPFVAPMIAARPLPGTTPQYDNMGHIVTGIEGHPHRSAGQCDDDRSRQQCRRGPWPAVPRVQGQARPA